MNGYWGYGKFLIIIIMLYTPRAIAAQNNICSIIDNKLISHTF